MSTTSDPSNNAPQLIHLHTLPSPTGLTRAWLSRSHPSPRTPLLATASSDKSVQVWDLRDYKLVSTINGGHKRSVRCVGWKDWGVSKLDIGRKTGHVADRNVEAEDDQARAKEKAVTLATGSFDSNVGIWVYNPRSSSLSANNQTVTAVPDGGASGINEVNEPDMTNPPDEDANNADDNDDEEWNFTTLLTGPDSEIKDLQFSPPHYGANLLATCSRDKSVWIWEEVEDDNEWETIAVLTEHTGDVKCVAWCSGATITVKDTGDGDVEIVGSREILATGSYDDTIRMWRDVDEEGDWTCVAVLEGHQGTVWDLCWESHVDQRFLSGDRPDARQWEPRIVSCSDDLTIKVWTRELSESEKEKKKERLASGAQGGIKQPKLPSIIRPAATVEHWVEETTLPQVHVRSIYAVDWSKQTGLLLSSGGDGTIVVYREVLDNIEDVIMNGNDEQEQQDAAKPAAAHNEDDSQRKKSKWIVTALIDAAHDEYEVNHVCWAPRRDKEKRWDDEEVIVSTGDDGNVKLWILPEALINEIREQK